MRIRSWMCLIIALIAGLSYVPHQARAQPVPAFFVVADYLPVVAWVDTPFNISYTTACPTGCSVVSQTGEFIVFEWDFFWSYHPFTLVSPCAPDKVQFDSELVYVYVDIFSQQVVGVASRFHCNWSGTGVISNGKVAVTAIPKPGVYSPDATLPVVTFLTNYHIPVNDYSNSTQARAILTTALLLGNTYTYLKPTGYNYTAVQTLPSVSSPIDPSSLLSSSITYWENIAFYIALPIHVLIFGVIFFSRRLKVGAPHG